MSHRALSPQQFFHGTTAELQPGDVIKPAAEVGTKKYPGLQAWRHKVAWVTDNEPASWHWGKMATNDKDNVKSYEVEPSETPTKRRHLDVGFGGAEYTAPYATVKRRIDIRPPEVPGAIDPINGSGRTGLPVQGRLPGTNWTKTLRPTSERIIRLSTHAEPKPEPEKKPSDHPGQGKLF